MKEEKISRIPARLIAENRPTTKFLPLAEFRFIGKQKRGVFGGILKENFSGNLRDVPSMLFVGNLRDGLDVARSLCPPDYTVRS